MSNKTKCPLPAGSGTNTFSDNLVGNQITTGSSQLTNTNFLFDSTTPEKDDRFFITDDFSKPITLDDLDPIKLEEVKQKSNETLIRFNKDKEDGSHLALFGSLKERLRVAVADIIKTFPAAIVSSSNITSNIIGTTATQITFNEQLNRTTFKIPQIAIKNDFDIEFSRLGETLPDDDYSQLRNFTKTYSNFVLDLGGITYKVINFLPPTKREDLLLTVDGKPFSGSTSTQLFLIRPNDMLVENFFSKLTETESVLLNRQVTPKYKASFKVPYEGDNDYYFTFDTATWTTVDNWNLDIKTGLYDSYLTKLNEIGEAIDAYKSNLITRFLITSSLQEFDTDDLKMDSVLKVYGHSFDDIKGFIDNISYMRNVTYDKINNVPDLLLKNLCNTLGLESVTTFTEDELNNVLYNTKSSSLSGEGKQKSLAEADIEMYRRILVNIGHLFKAKGTRKAIEFFLKFIGAPESIIEFNEYVYKVDNSVNYKYLNSKVDSILAGTHKKYDVTYVNNLYVYEEVESNSSFERGDFPFSEDGTPISATVSSNYYFQKGAGWFERTIEHRSSEILDLSRSVLTGNPKIIKTKLKEFTYGEPYFDRYRKFPMLNVGYTLSNYRDNKKVQTSTTDTHVLNRKNVDIMLSASKGVDYDVWRQSNIHRAHFGNLTTTGLTFAQFADKVLKEGIKNINTVKYDKKYTDLLNIYDKYYSYSGITKPFTNTKVDEYIKKISPLWIRIVEQFIPATTLWFGGNKISNNSFHRQKFQYKQTCKVLDTTDLLYPSSFLETLYSEIHSTFKNQVRGLCVLSGVTFKPVLEVDSVDMVGEGVFVVPFSGYTKPNTCGKYPTYNGALPLICDYADHLTFNESTFRQGWINEIEELLNKINTEETYLKAGLTGATYDQKVYSFTTAEWGTTGTTVTGSTSCITPGAIIPKKKVDYEIYDDNGIMKIRFKTLKYGYSDCIKTLNLGFLIEQNVDCQDCDMYVEFLPVTVFNSEVPCSGTVDYYLKVVNGTPFDDGFGLNKYRFYVDCKDILEYTGFTTTDVDTCDTIQLNGVNPTNSFELLVGDQANCQMRIRVDGLESVCYNDELGAQKYGCFPTIEILQTFDVGYPSGTTVLRLTNTGVTEPVIASNISISGIGTEDNISLITEDGEDILLETINVELVTVEQLQPNDVIISVSTSSENSRTCDYTNIESTGGFFTMDYKFMTVQEVNCLFTTKSIIINSGFTFTPDQEIYMYDGLNFHWRQVKDIEIGDSVIDYLGNLIPVTSVVLNDCTNELYYHIQSHYIGANGNDDFDRGRLIYMTSAIGQNDILVTSNPRAYEDLELGYNIELTA